MACNYDVCHSHHYVCPSHHYVCPFHHYVWPLPPLCVSLPPLFMSLPPLCMSLPPFQVLKSLSKVYTIRVGHTHPVWLWDTPTIWVENLLLVSVEVNGSKNRCVPEQVVQRAWRPLYCSLQGFLSLTATCVCRLCMRGCEGVCVRVCTCVCVLKCTHNAQKVSFAGVCE